MDKLIEKQKSIFLFMGIGFVIYMITAVIATAAIIFLNENTVESLPVFQKNIILGGLVLSVIISAVITLKQHSLENAKILLTLLKNVVAAISLPIILILMD